MLSGALIEGDGGGRARLLGGGAWARAGGVSSRGRHLICNGANQAFGDGLGGGQGAALAGQNGVEGSLSDAFDSFDETFAGDAGTIDRTVGSGPVDTAGGHTL